MIRIVKHLTSLKSDVIIGVVFIVAFVEDSGIWKSCIVFCAKPKEVDPIRLISLPRISVSIALKYNNNYN